MRFLFVLVLSLHVGLAGAADLVSAYRDALGYDAQYAAARASRDAGLEKEAQGLAGLLPTVNFSANTNWNSQKSTLRLDDATPVYPRYNNNGWTVQLTQPLFRVQNWVSFRQGELAAAAAELQLLNARNDLAVRVAQAYFEVLLAQETVASAQAQVVAITEQLASARKNFELGAATVTDTDEAQARFDLARAQELAAQSDLILKRKALQAITGQPAATLSSLRQPLRMPRPQPDDINQWVAAAEANNPNVLLGENALETASREVDKQRAGHLPTLDFVASRGTSAQSTTLNIGVLRPGSDTEASSVGLQLAIPLYAGGSISSRTREAIALKEKAQADLDNARRIAVLNAQQSYLGVSSGLLQVQAYDAALASSQSAVASNKLGYKVGVRMNIDVLNAQSQLYDTRQKLAKAKIDTLLSQLKLKAAAGELQEEDLMAVNGLLE